MASMGPRLRAVNRLYMGYSRGRHLLPFDRKMLFQIKRATELLTLTIMDLAPHFDLMVVLSFNSP